MKLYLDNIEANLFTKEREVESMKIKLNNLLKRNKELEDENALKDQHAKDLENDIYNLKQKYNQKIKILEDVQVINNNNNNQGGISTSVNNNNINNNLKELSQSYFNKSKHMQSSSLNFNDAKLKIYSTNNELKKTNTIKEKNCASNLNKINLVNTINTSSQPDNKKNKIAKSTVFNEAWKTSSTGFLDKADKSDNINTLTAYDTILKKTINVSKEPNKVEYQTVVVHKDAYDSLSRSTSKGNPEVSARILSGNNNNQLNILNKKKSHHNVTNSIKLNKEFIPNSSSNPTNNSQVGIIHLQGNKSKNAIIRVLSKKNSSANNQMSIRSQSLNSDSKENINVMNTIGNQGKKGTDAGKEKANNKNENSTNLIYKNTESSSNNKENKPQLLVRLSQNKEKLNSITARK